LSASKISKQKEIRAIATVSSLLIAWANRRNKTANIGGKNRYILLKPSYATNNSTYKKGVKDF
jgi:hypothetical protein